MISIKSLLGTVGAAAGTAIGGPVGGSIGGMLGGALGGALDNTGKRDAEQHKIEPPEPPKHDGGQAVQMSQPRIQQQPMAPRPQAEPYIFEGDNLVEQPQVNSDAFMELFG